MPAKEPDDSHAYSTPRPDPTILTTEQLHREVGALQTLLRSEMAALKEFFTEKLNTMEEYRVEQKQDTSAAVAAALLAAKEAVKEQTIASDKAISKSEMGTSKQIEAQSEKIDDLKDRLTTLEGQKKGGSDTWGYVFGALGLLIALAAVVVAIAVAVTSHK